MVWPKEKHDYDEYITFLGKNNTRILKNLTFNLQEIEKLNSSIHLLIFLVNMDSTALSEHSFELALKTHINSLKNKKIVTAQQLPIQQLVSIIEQFQEDNSGTICVNILTQPLRMKKKVEQYIIKNKTIEIDFTVTL